MSVEQGTEKTRKSQEQHIMDDSFPLHVCHNHVHRLLTSINNSHALIHCFALAFLVYYRVSFLFQDPETRKIPIIPWLLVFASELLLCFQWLLGRAYRWRLVSRTVFPERLPRDDKLPGIDVFICTADSNKEPTVEVMNTVLSAMALDYPVDKLHVYLSDDGGAAITLHGMREAWRFARWWLPFCRRYGIKTRCPKAYFSGADAEYDHYRASEFKMDREKIEAKYGEFKEGLLRAIEDGLLRDTGSGGSGYHPPVIEVIKENCNETVLHEEQVEMPLLVYVSREKKPPRPHHFKAGALNVLLRVSGVMSNSPYILLLDCDMYCSDPSSARQAMCLHLDPNMSSSLAFVQFPQKFHGISENDIYDSELRSVFRVLWYGCDGLKGPPAGGTNYCIKRTPLYSNYMHKVMDIEELQHTFGQSNEFIKSMNLNEKCGSLINGGDFSSKLLQETRVLASCTYEDHTKWGKKIGFWYLSVLEDYFTGFVSFHCQGWRTVYLNPSRPQFLGTPTTNLNDVLIQSTRWSTGLVEVALSRFCPLIYGPLRMSFLESMCYAELAFFPLLYSFSLCCFGTIPQLCLLVGIPLFPEASNPFFFVFSFIFLSALLQHSYDVLIVGGSTRILANEQRMWMIKSVTSYVYGSLDAILKKLSIKQANFSLTNKAVDDEQIKRYQMGIFDFQTSTMFLAPLVTIAIMNMASFFVGITRLIISGGGDRLLVQVFLSFYIIILNYPIIEAMTIRTDKGCIPLSLTLLCALFLTIVLSLGSMFVVY